VDAERRLARHQDLFEQLDLFPVDEERGNIDREALVEQVRPYAELVIRRLVGLIRSRDAGWGVRRQVVRTSGAVARRNAPVHHGVAAHVPPRRNRVGEVIVARVAGSDGWRSWRASQKQAAGRLRSGLLVL